MKLESLLAYCTAAEFGRLTAQLQLMQLQVSELRAIDIGLSNHSFCLTALSTSGATQRYLLRINAPVTDVICDRTNEVACWRSAEAAGLAPSLYWVDPLNRFYLAQWLDEASANAPNLTPWQQFSARQSLSSAELAERVQGHSPASLLHVSQQLPLNHTEQQLLSKLQPLLQGLRQLPAPALDISLARQWQIYIERLQQMRNSNNFAQHAAKDGADWLQRFEQLQQFDCRSVLSQLDEVLIRHQYCHRDLSANNLLLTAERLMCVDFEYCCSSHPLFELVGVLATHQLSPAAQQQLIGGYLLQHPYVTADALMALPAALDIFWLYSCAWALQMADGQCKDASEFFSWFDNYWQLVRK